MLDRRDRRIVARGGDVKARWRDVNVITMAHPDQSVLVFVKAAEQPPTPHPHGRPAILPPSCPDDGSTGQVGDELHPVADAEHRDAEFEQRGVGRGDILTVHRAWSAGEDDTFRVPLADPFDVVGRRMDFRVHMGFPHPARNQLRVLGPEVDDENSVVVHGHPGSIQPGG
jgi:hypothetical protein